MYKSINNIQTNNSSKQAKNKELSTHIHLEKIDKLKRIALGIYLL